MIFIFGVWFAFSYPYFLQQKVPFPSKHLVTTFSPWSYYEKFAGPVKNNAMSDIIYQIYPWKHFTIQMLKQGEIPYWNPYAFAGNPHLANFQSAIFSPFNLPFFLLPFVDAWSLLILLQPLLAGFFLYLFMREQQISQTGSLISSVAFMFCGFMVGWMAYGTLAMAIAFLPLTLFAIEKSFHKKTFWMLPVISIGLAASYFSGHIQTSLYLTVFSIVYIFFKLFVTRNVRSFLLVGLFFSLGVCIALIQIIPTFALYHESIRSSLVYPDGQIPLSHVVTIFAPDYFGNPVTRSAWMGYYAEWANFIGIIPLLLAFFSFFKPKPSVYFFWIAGILAFAFSSDTPLRQLLAVSRIPVFATSIPSRMVVLFSFSFAVLAGFGLDALLALIKKRKYKQIILPIFIGLIIFMICLVLLILHLLPSDKTSIAIRNLLFPSMLSLLALIAIALSFFFRKFAIIIVCVVLLLLTAIDSLRFATKWMPFDEKTLVFPDLAVIQKMQEHIGYGRVFGHLGQQVASYYGLAMLDGYDPLYIERYGEFILTSKTGEYMPADRAIVEVTNQGRYTKRVLDLLGVNLIFHPKIDTKKEWALPVWRENKIYTKIYDDEKFQLYTNNTALPRAKLFYKYEVIQDKKELLRRFYTENFDYRNVLLLEDDPQIIEAGIQQPRNSVAIISYTSNKVIISVETEIPALLFLSDNYYPKWTVMVNGNKEKIYRSDYAFRAVIVPKGKSTVEFVYGGLF